MSVLSLTEVRPTEKCASCGTFVMPDGKLVERDFGFDKGFPMDPLSEYGQLNSRYNGNVPSGMCPPCQEAVRLGGPGNLYSGVSAL